MSLLVQTDYGWFRAIDDGTWRFECPSCGEWLPLTDDMMSGRVSVFHAADNPACTYHETRNYAQALYNAKSGREAVMCDEPGCHVLGDHDRHRDGSWAT